MKWLLFDILDDKIKMKQAVHFIVNVVKVIIGDVFLGIFIGLFALFYVVKWS